MAPLPVAGAGGAVPVDAPGGSAGPRVRLPRELVLKVCEWVPPIQFLGAWAATCTQLSFRWYAGTVFPRTVVVPDDAPSLNAAINLLASDGASTGKGLVLVRPGTYAESVRITQNCHILGFGPCDKVVVEAPGWESALVSAGLGGRKVPTLLGWETLASGEDARVENLTFRCRNQNMQGRCVYIVMGQLHLVRCNVDGGILISGACTAPHLSDCHIRKSRGNGVHLTDHCKAALRRNVVAQHGGHGVLIDRHSSPEVVQNTIQQNAVCGIRLFEGSLRPRGAYAAGLEAISDNHFEDNGDAEISTSPRFAEAEAEAEEGGPGM